MCDFDMIECGKCGIVFHVPKHWRECRMESKEDFYCPNGHCRVYEKSRADVLADKLEREQAENNRLREQIEHERRRTSAQFGENTKLRKRIGNGVCPCCSRSFTNVARHMAQKHPDFKEPQKESA